MRAVSYVPGVYEDIVFAGDHRDEAAFLVVF